MYLFIYVIMILFDLYCNFFVFFIWFKVGFYDFVVKWMLVFFLNYIIFYCKIRIVKYIIFWYVIIVVFVFLVRFVVKKYLFFFFLKVIKILTYNSNDFINIFMNYCELDMYDLKLKLCIICCFVRIIYFSNIYLCDFFRNCKY